MCSAGARVRGVGAQVLFKPSVGKERSGDQGEWLTCCLTEKTPCRALRVLMSLLLPSGCIRGRECMQGAVLWFAQGRQQIKVGPQAALQQPSQLVCLCRCCPDLPRPAPRTCCDCCALERVPDARRAGYQSSRCGSCPPRLGAHPCPPNAHKPQQPTYAACSAQHAACSMQQQQQQQPPLAVSVTLLE